MRIGRDYLGGYYYKKTILESHEAGYGIGFFWEQFGKISDFLKKCADKGSGWSPFYRIQGLWAGSSHNYKGKEKKAHKIGEELFKIAEIHPGIDFFYSPFCETNHLNEQFLNRLHADLSSRLRIVHSPNKNAPLSKKYMNETHGDYRPNGVDCYSYDGLSCVNADVEMIKEWGEGLEYMMYWYASDNGRKNDSASTPPLPNNKRMHWTTNKTNKSIFYQAGNTRTECTLKKGTLSKSHADPDTPPNPKEDNKLVILSPVKGSKCDLKSGGKVIATAKHSGVSHEDGRNIYRFNKWGYELAKKSRNVEVWINGKNLGKIDPGFRVNEYRNKH